MSDWEVDSPGYSPEKFYTRSTDARGHTETMWLRLPPSLARVIAEVVQSRKIPQYRTAQDLVRDAIVHRLHYLKEKLPETGTTVTQFLIGMEDVLAHQRMMSDFEKKMEELSQTVQRLMLDSPNDGPALAKELVQNLYGEAAKIADHPYWRNKFLRYFRERYKEFLEE